MSADTRATQTGDTRHPYLLLALFTGMAMSLRAKVAFQGGIWADEGFFLGVMQIPSWSAMMSYLHFHESHPPLFYVAMRAWSALFGTSDRALLTLPILLGATIVPATYAAGAALYTRRAGLVAAGFTAVSAGLIEYSAQIRPYCVLPTLMLLSCLYLVRALRSHAGRDWMLYALWTALSLYTHNWAWLVAAGQMVAAAVVTPDAENRDKLRSIRDFALAWIAVVVAFLPWMPAFLYQAAHAGHQSFLLRGMGERVGLYLYFVMSAPEMLLLGTLAQNARLMILVAAFVAIVVAIAAALYGRGREAPAQQPVGERRSRAASVAFVTITVVALIIAITLSPRSNLMMGRVVVTLGPLVLLVFSSWVVRCIIPWNKRGAPSAAAFAAFVLVWFAFGFAWTARSPRSNSRDLALTLERELQPTDILVLASELYAPAFNHYFKLTIEQVDFPNTGRAGLIGFADPFDRAEDSLPLRGIRQRIADARRQGRRVWLPSSRRFRRPTPQEVADAYRLRNATIMWRLRIKQIRDVLAQSYGPPDSSFSGTGPAARYDRLGLDLYSVRQ